MGSNKSRRVEDIVEDVGVLCDVLVLMDMFGGAISGFISEYSTRLDD